MDGRDTFDGFELQQEPIFDDDVGRVAHIQPNLSPYDRNGPFGLDPKPSPLKFVDHDGMIRRLQQAGTKLGVNVESDIDGRLRQLVLGHLTLHVQDRYLKGTGLTQSRKAARKG